MRNRDYPVVCPSVVAFELDDHLVLYSPRQESFFVANPTAAQLWSHLSAGASIGDAVRNFVRQFGISKGRAELDVKQILTEWSAAGLLAVDQQQRANSSPVRSGLSVQLGRGPSTVIDPPPLPVVALRALDVEIQIFSSDASLLSDIESVLGQLVKSESRDAAHPIRLVVQERVPGWELKEGGDVLATCGARENVIPLVYTFVHMLAYLRSDCFAAVHAAAVCDGARCILMPAASGSGKSTLTAALYAAGMECCADDMAVLSSPPIRLRPVASRIALKDGSWGLLREQLPIIDELPAYLREDGKYVKYLAPNAPRGEGLAGPDREVTHLIFPRYDSGSRCRLSVMPRAVALSRLTAAGYDSTRRISQEWIGALTDWLRDIECFALEFDSLDSAVRLIADSTK